MDKNTNNSAIGNTPDGFDPQFNMSTIGGSSADDKPEVNPATLQEEVNKTSQSEKPQAADSNTGLFLVRTANQCLSEANKRPIPKKLFGELWFEGELCILYADTNLGKSICAVQIGDGISRGRKTLGLEIGSKQTVLYLDCELNDKQFETRYSQEFKNHYNFSDSFHRAEIDPDASIPESYKGDFERFLVDSIKQALERTKAEVLIVDNITYLRSATEKAQDALPLMKELKELKSKYKISILCLAHTPKRDLSKPITRNDLQGSKMLINFCDSAFAIGESHKDKSVRYIKQIKARNTEIVYDSENVIHCEISKPSNFLQFDLVGFGSESEHLKSHTPGDRSELISKVKELSGQGRTQREIAAELNISVGAVNKYLKKEEQNK
ncbi:MAG: AAA family ATPase [Saprospiraceae bacterium]|nr:AAA family ATPase [Saprospiraceae bacterium]